MASDSTALLTTEEASDLLGLVFADDTAEAIAWAELEEQGQLRCLIRATADSNRVPWIGRDLVHGQVNRWPRRHHQYPHETITDRVGVDTSSEFTQHMPIAIRRAVAAQAATHAAREAGFEDNERIHKAAAVGVTGQSAGGMNESIDPTGTRRSWSHLCLIAQQFAEPFVARTAGGA